MWRAPVDLEAELARLNGSDPLAHPLVGTPEDLFGRVRGKFCVTASNIAKFDGHHGLVVFDERNPLRWNREQVHDYVDTAWHWAELAHQSDPDALYYLFIWNCLWRAGASLLHGHAQMMLGRDMHYADVEKLRRAALLYQAASRHNYFEDLFRAHRDVGAAFERPDGIRVLANLTPIKENEVLLLSPRHVTRATGALKDALYDVLACYRDRLGVTSFNVAIYQPPMAETEENWEGFPVVVRIVDRGDPSSRTVDIGSMELYAASVVSSDPFKLAHALEEGVGAA
jgi:galactose-1-phosphate uridylyltransferase